MTYDSLTALRPDLILLSLSAYGASGPWRDVPGIGGTIEPTSGMSALNGYGDGPPMNSGAMLPDAIAGYYGLAALMTALHQRDRTGEGQYIDLSMSDMLTHLMPEAVFDYAVNARQPMLQGNRDRLHAPQGVYRCRGWDAWVGISITTEREWRALCDVLGQPELAEDPQFATAEERQARHDELDALITRWTRRNRREEAVRLLQEAGVAAGASFNTKDLLNDRHLKARGFVWAVDHPETGRRRMLGVPWRISGMAPVRVRRAPLLGEHTEEVLQGLLGLDPQEVQRLADEQVAY